MDYNALMKLASENKVSAEKQRQQKQKADNSKMHHASEEKVSNESVKAFLAKREEEKKQRRAEEEEAKRARIKARLESMNKAKVVKSLSSCSDSQTPSKSAKSQTAFQSSKSKNASGSYSEKIERQRLEKSQSSLKFREKHSQTPSKSAKPQTASQSSKNNNATGSTSEKLERQRLEKSQSSSKFREKCSNSSSTLTRGNETKGRKKDKELAPKTKKQRSNKTLKAGPVTFKDLLKIAEKKAKDPNARIGEHECERLSFPTGDQMKQRQKCKGDKIISNSHTETKSRHKTNTKERKTEQIGSRKTAKSGTKMQPPQNSKHGKTLDPGPSTSKALKLSPTAQKGASIESQLSLSLTKVKSCPETSSKNLKAPNNLKINGNSLQKREKHFVDRREVPVGSGIEAQFGSRTSQERKRKHEDNEFNYHSEKYFDRKTAKRALPRTSGIEAQVSSNKGIKWKVDEYGVDGYDDDEFDDFIDDGDDDVDVSSHIRAIFGYDKSRYRDSEDDLRHMESSYSQIEKEEVKSLQLARLEDEVEFLKEQAMLKKERERLKRSLKHK